MLNKCFEKAFLLQVVLAILENESLAHILSLEKQVHIHTYVQRQYLIHYAKEAPCSLPKVEYQNVMEKSLMVRPVLFTPFESTRMNAQVGGH